MSVASATSIDSRVSLLVSASSGLGSGPAAAMSSPELVSHCSIQSSSTSAVANDEKVAARW